LTVPQRRSIKNSNVMDFIFYTLEVCRRIPRPCLLLGLFTATTAFVHAVDILWISLVQSSNALDANLCEGHILTDYDCPLAAESGFRLCETPRLRLAGHEAGRTVSSCCIHM
jgi:hypothetical protein